ncbi:Nramp family divalent metal transporter [Flavilitoribacter nigricans]|uniref:Iron transporter n=1 Tax=Flavilitoribacter nigricans (strain ATCC 23147 / DSM 23189 / NBRC 102662 / NCIMB 1420 / SS-2) TaxID=1122177 RepID=A0A2D0N8W9_FLAN2|nr:Nramp family divalent metal transporter [Flavilitoribacter nigricans]PHN04954.1 iron transporter [Flavilitoribacter nigricans DSM 23189 = NBRC 102662]
MNTDPYVLTTAKILEPPTSFSEKLKHLGPGFILSASIVGSGELIATTTLGARAGFITFWVIIISCLVKVAVQVEFGKHTILTGETSMKAFNQLPGPKLGRARWTVWLIFLFMFIKLLQVGGIIGGVAIILNMTFPQIGMPIWALLTATAVALLIFRGYYRFIEKFSLGMIGFFTLFTFSSLYFLGYTPYAMEWSDITSGLSFQLPPEAVAIAFGAFGITGVGGDEIIHYNYWCLEKGYAAHTGPRDDSEAWKARARGWIRVMYLDALLAMIVYTVVTAAFYLLGAAVLHAQGTVPEGYQMVESLSMMYTESIGPQAKPAFLLGAFVVLFSTLFAALAAWTRQWADIFGQIGLIDFYNLAVRKKAIAILAWVIPFLWALLFLFIQLPVLMVISGGIAGSFLLFIVVAASLHFRYKRLHPDFRPNITYDILLWVSILTIVGVGIYGLIKVFS